MPSGHSICSLQSIILAIENILPSVQNSNYNPVYSWCQKANYQFLHFHSFMYQQWQWHLGGYFFMKESWQLSNALLLPAILRPLMSQSQTLLPFWQTMVWPMNAQRLTTQPATAPASQRPKLEHPIVDVGMSVKDWKCVCTSLGGVPH